LFSPRPLLIPQFLFSLSHSSKGLLHFIYILLNKRNVVYWNNQSYRLFILFWCASLFCSGFVVTTELYLT
jgi:hypothetical protein